MARSSGRALVATIVFCALLAGSVASQISAEESRFPTGGSRSGQAARVSVGYLMRACSPRGRFAYIVDASDGGVSRSYNIVRHAGAIYSLAMFNRFHPDVEVVDTMARAAHFMRTVYMSDDRPSNTLVVWSTAAAGATESNLGDAGLGLAALAEVARARRGSIQLEDLRSLGRFVLSMQRPDGSFFSRYRATVGPVPERGSMYYPGEAILGLIDLYEIDQSRLWLNAAARGLSYLARSRQAVQNLPDDHWALIATAKFLPYYDRVESPASRDELIRHASNIGKAMLIEQVKTADDPRLVGGFTPDGGTTPTAIRLEGLLAVLEFLPREDKQLRKQIEVATRLGVDFLIRAQIKSGPFAGGMPAVLPRTSLVMKAAARESEVRIDYVQHALCVWLRYENMFERGANRGDSK
jgi:hypothetical protein